MSTSIDQAFVKHFQADVHMAYQRLGSKLRQTVRSKGGIQGSSTVFQRVGAGTASTKSRHGQLPVMNLHHTPVECFLYDYYPLHLVDPLYAIKVQSDALQVIATPRPP